LKNTLFVIASEAKQSHKQLIIKEIATAHMRLAMTGSKFFKGLLSSSMEFGIHDTPSFLLLHWS